MQAVILAAGRGSRLRPITLTRSKAMAPIAGKPMVARVMDGLSACGIDAFIVVAHPDDAELIEYNRGNAEPFGDVQIIFQSERRGTAHALIQAAPFIRGRFVLSACDSIVPTGELEHMLHLWQDSPNLDALLALLPSDPERISAGASVALDGPWVTRIVEKPRPEDILSGMASLPLYCFTKHILDYLPHVTLSSRGEYELPEAIQMLIEGDASVCGYAFSERRTLTNATDLLNLNRHYLELGAACGEGMSDTIAAGKRLVEPVCIEPGSVVGASCTIGPGVFLERGCQIGDGVTLRRAVVLPGAVVPNGSTIEDAVVT